MAFVVLLRGVNVGGHRSVRPSVLAQQLRRFDVVNVGAAGTFVVRKTTSQAELCALFRARLPFDAHVMICRGTDVLRLVSSSPLAGVRSDPHIVPFVSLLATRRQPSSPLPQRFPATGEWGLRIVGQQGRFVFGVYRREMRAISYLAQLDQLFGVPATTRSWNTMTTIARLLGASQAPSSMATAAERGLVGQSRRAPKEAPAKRDLTSACRRPRRVRC
jgi:uncharacterized protein (DUF1697 family)